jgi:hypothetical protein
MENTMSTKSKLALVAALVTLVAAPAFAADQQASEAALDRIQTNLPSGAYASVNQAPRAERAWQPEIRNQGNALGNATVDFQATGGH